MRVLVRTDASVAIGSGHVMRCLTLADQLRDKGAKVVFISAVLPGALFDLIRARGYEFGQLSALVESDFMRDASESIVVAGELMPGISDWLIVDHYQLDSRWEEMMRRCCHQVMVIDDIANRPHSCELLLDQNYDDQSRYQGLVPANCRLLLGSRYALLRPEYAFDRRVEVVRRRPLQKVFVFFGGSDSKDLTGMCLKALMAPGLIALDVDVVVGANYVHYESLSKLAAARGNTTIHGPRLHLADLMVAADIAIGAGGVTNWERVAVGLPSLVVSIADNQVPISEQLHRDGVIHYLGKSEYVTETMIQDVMLEEIETKRYLDRISPSLAACDGHGVGRVLKAMH